MMRALPQKSLKSIPRFMELLISVVRETHDKFPRHVALSMRIKLGDKIIKKLRPSGDF